MNSIVALKLDQFLRLDDFPWRLLVQANVLTKELEIGCKELDEHAAGIQLARIIRGPADLTACRLTIDWLQQIQRLDLPTDVTDRLKSANAKSASKREKPSSLPP